MQNLCQRYVFRANEIFKDLGISPKRYSIRDDILLQEPWNRKDIGIFINSACNLKCPYCINRNMPKGDMSLDTFKRIVHVCSSSIIKPNVYILGGEPFLHKDISEFIGLIKPVCNAVRVLTNGTVPFEPIKGVKYCFTFHSLAARFKNTFIRNIERARFKNVDFEILLPLNDEIQRNFYRELQDLSLDDNVVQLVIDGTLSSDRRADSGEIFLFNNKLVKNRDFTRLKLYQFNGWNCHLSDIHIMQNGDIVFECMDKAIKLTDFDINKEYFTQCTARYCDRECKFGTLKYYGS